MINYHRIRNTFWIYSNQEFNLSAFGSFVKEKENFSERKKNLLVQCRADLSYNTIFDLLEPSKKPPHQFNVQKDDMHPFVDDIESYEEKSGQDEIINLTNIGAQPTSITKMVQYSAKSLDVETSEFFIQKSEPYFRRR